LFSYTSSSYSVARHGGIEARLLVSFSGHIDNASFTAERVQQGAARQISVLSP
jgi:hypothetical protein